MRARGSDPQGPDPQGPDRDTELARIERLIQRGDLAGARARLQTIRPQLPARADVLGAAGAAAFRARDPHAALELMQQAAGLAPDDASAHHNLGEVHLALGQLEPAEGAYRRSVQLSPSGLASQLGLAVVLERRGTWGEAEHAYRRGLELQPRHPGAQLGLGNALRAQGDLEAARDAYRGASRADPSMLSAYNNLGGVLQEIEDFEGAEAAYCTVVERHAAHANGLVQPRTVSSAHGAPRTRGRRPCEERPSCSRRTREC